MRAHDLPSLPKTKPLGTFAGVRSLSGDAEDLGVSYSGGFPPGLSGEELIHGIATKHLP